MRVLLILLMVCLPSEASEIAKSPKQHRTKSGAKKPIKKTRPIAPYDWEQDMMRRGGIPNDGWCIYG